YLVVGVSAAECGADGVLRWTTLLQPGRQSPTASEVFPDCTIFVDLSVLRDANEVPSAVASAIGLRQPADPNVARRVFAWDSASKGGAGARQLRAPAARHGFRRLPARGFASADDPHDNA